MEADGELLPVRAITKCRDSIRLGVVQAVHRDEEIFNPVEVPSAVPQAGVGRCTQAAVELVLDGADLDGSAVHGRG